MKSFRNLARGIARAAQTQLRAAKLPGKWRRRDLAADLFDAAWYLATYPDVADAGVEPLMHYRTVGVNEGRNPNTLFDSGWYLKTYPDVARAGLDPFAHYLAHGAAEGRNPSPLFETSWYLRTHPEVLRSGLHPLEHYIRHGAKSGWRARPPRPRKSGKKENPAPPNGSVVRAVEQIVSRFAPIEPDLAMTVGKPLRDLAVVEQRWDSRARTWRELIRSLDRIPKRVLLVESLAEEDALLLAVVRACHEIGEARDTLVISTDDLTIPVPDWLPPGSAWRALSEYGDRLADEDRIAIIVGLLHQVRPEATLVHGSRFGWEVYARHGAALAQEMELFAVLAPAAAQTPVYRDLTLRYFRHCLPFLAALYCQSRDFLDTLARNYGVPAESQRKLVLIQRPVEFDGAMARVGASLPPDGTGGLVLWAGDPACMPAAAERMGRLDPPLRVESAAMFVGGSNGLDAGAGPGASNPSPSEVRPVALVRPASMAPDKTLLDAAATGLPVVFFGRPEPNALLDRTTAWPAQDVAELPTVIQNVVSDPTEARRRSLRLWQRITDRYSKHAFLQVLTAEPGFLAERRATLTRRSHD